MSNHVTVLYLSEEEKKMIQKMILHVQENIILRKEHETKLQNLLDRLNFQCKKCGNCCRNLKGFPFREEDLNLEYLGNKELLNLLRVKMENFHGNDCPFLEKDNSCLIYDHRPYICQLFPISKEAVTVVNCHGWNHLK